MDTGDERAISFYEANRKAFLGFHLTGFLWEFLGNFSIPILLFLPFLGEMPVWDFMFLGFGFLPEEAGEVLQSVSYWGRIVLLLIFAASLLYVLIKYGLLLFRKVREKRAKETYRKIRKGANPFHFHSIRTPLVRFLVGLVLSAVGLFVLFFLLRSYLWESLSLGFFLVVEGASLLEMVLRFLRQVFALRLQKAFEKDGLEEIPPGKEAI